MSKYKKQKRKDTVLLSRASQNIKKIREDLDLSQMQLEANTKLKIYKYESGSKEMTLTTLGIIAKELKTEPYKLLM